MKLVPFIGPNVVSFFIIILPIKFVILLITHIPNFNKIVLSLVSSVFYFLLFITRLVLNGLKWRKFLSCIAFQILATNFLARIIRPTNRWCTFFFLLQIDDAPFCLETWEFWIGPESNTPLLLNCADWPWHTLAEL